MKRILITIDDEAAKVLAKSSNQSETVRQALKVYQSGISTETFAGIAASYRVIEKRLTEIESKLDYIKPTESWSEPVVVLDSQDPDDAPRDLGEVLNG